MEHIHHDAVSYHVKVDPAGRLTIPAELRARHGIRSGDELLLVASDSMIEVKTRAQMLREAQDLFCRAAPASRVLSEELLAERRRDASLDN